MSSSEVRVLLIEDEQSTALILERQIRAVQSMRCSVEVADTLARARALLAAEKFDLIIADLHLPDSPGPATIAALVRMCDQPVIALTADETPALRERAMASGAYDFLLKGQVSAAALDRLVRLAALQANTFHSLRASQARLKAIVDAEPECVKLLDADGRLLEMNPAGLAMIEADALEPVRGHCVYDLVAEEHREAFRALVEATARGEERALEFEINGLKGTRRWLQMRSVPLPDAGGATLVLGITRDITGQRQAEDALRESEARFRSLVALSTDFYWETDAEHRVTVNTYRARHSAAGESVIGRRRWEMPSTHPDAAGWAAHRETLEARLPFRDFEFGRLDPSGHQRFLTISGEPMRGPRGEFLGYRGVGRDISERRRIMGLVALEHAVGRLLSEAAGAPEALTGAIRAICESERWECGRYFGVDEGAQVMRFQHGWAAAGSEMERFVQDSAGLFYEPDQGLVGHAWSSGEPVWAEDASRDPRVARKALATKAGVHGALVFPLSFRGRTVGALSFSSGVVRRPDARLMSTMLAIGSQLAQFLERKQAEAALSESEARFRRTFELAASGIAHVSLDGRFLEVNSALCSILGYGREELIGRSVKDISHPEDRDLSDPMRVRMREGEVDSVHVEKRYLRKDGSVVWVNLTVALARNAAGEPQHEITVVEDITRRAAQVRYQKKIARLGQAALDRRDAGEFISTAVQSLLEGLDGGAVAYVERGAVPGEAVVRRVAGVEGAEEAAAACPPGSALARVLEGGEPEVTHAPWEGGAPLPAAWTAGYRSALLVPVPGDREVRGALVALSADPGAHGPEETRFLHAAASLLSAALHRFDSEARLAYLAQFDTLTGLPNRALLSDRFSQLVVQARRRETVLGVLFIDLDDFKLVNDSQGHAAGDELLKEVAQRLKASVRPGDTVARISGDEFAVVLVDLGRPDDAALVAQKILDRLAAPAHIAGQECFITASIGISTFPADGTGAEALLGAADAAMYRAKQAGRNAFQFFTAQINQRTRARAQLSVELRRALERREFRLAYQPKMHLATGQPSGAEALLRWEHPERGTVEPSEFIPVLEETGLIVPVGEWVIARACDDLKAWQSQGLPALPVAVNLSARQFRQQDLDDRIRSVLEKAGVGPAMIELEITESQLMHDPEHAVRILRSLAEAGLRIAVDDFGTGYSSLAYLTRFPLTALKIDRSFVADVLTDEADATIVRTIIDMAHTLRFTVVAEGVESEAQAALLRVLGCEQAQGYLFARPMSAADFARFIAAPAPGARAATRAPKRRVRRA